MMFHLFITLSLIVGFEIFIQFLNKTFKSILLLLVKIINDMLILKLPFPQRGRGPDGCVHLPLYCTGADAVRGSG